MTIGIISFDGRPNIGGLGAVVASDEVLLKESGHDVVTLSPHTDIASRLGFPPWLRCRHGQFLSCPLFSLWFHFALPKFIREAKPNVLMIHTGSGGIFLLQRPSVLTLAIAHHTYRQECQFVFQPFSIRWVFRRIMSFLEGITYRNVDHILAVSSTTADSVIQDYGIHPSKVMVVENCVDRVWFDRSWKSPQRESHEARVILSVGRLEERKGTLELLQSFAALQQRCEFPVQLQLIGKNMMGTIVQEIIVELGIDNDVTLHGHLSDDERVQAMENCDLFIAPSKLEGFGLAAAESLTIGCPTIVTDVPGLRSLVIDHKTGLVAGRDPASIANAMYTLLHDKDVQTSIAENGRKVAVERFDPRRRCSELRSAFTQCLNSL